MFLTPLSTSKSLIESITGRKVELFRPPYGDYSDALLATAKENGLYTIQWECVPISIFSDFASFLSVSEYFSAQNPTKKNVPHASFSSSVFACGCLKLHK